jgi:hypothetical protein
MRRPRSVRLSDEEVELALARGVNLSAAVRELITRTDRELVTIEEYARQVGLWRGLARYHQRRADDAIRVLADKVRYQRILEDGALERNR